MLEPGKQVRNQIFWQKNKKPEILDSKVLNVSVFELKCLQLVWVWGKMDSKDHNVNLFTP